jgi:ectoine hydroxylase-related dioxygenase (phytanoyl-CoA dioxygenase family)
MKFQVKENDILKYRENGYHVFPQVIPSVLLKDLRREAAKAQEIAWRVNGSQAQRLQPIDEYADELDITPFKLFTEIDGLNEAIQKLTSPKHSLKPTEGACLLFQPRDRPWSTEWHRDWRDHITDENFNAHVGDARWEEILNDPDFFNQVNCPLFEDTSTWFVPGSHLRVENLEDEMRVYRSTTQEELRDEENNRTDEELELFCLNYCQAMPGAVQLVLNPGDFCLYRNTAWHIGNYVPYRRRMTLHTHAMTPEFQEFAVKYRYLLKPREASLERHAKLAG